MNPRHASSPESDRLEHWVREHGRAVRGYLLGLVRRPEIADDLVQETFWRAWRSGQRYQETGLSRAYLLKIADRLACDHFRSRGREVQLDADMWNQVEPASDWAGPEEQFADSESQTALKLALDALSPAQRRVLLLRYYGGLEFADIARQCDAPLGTVLSHCRRGLQALRKLLTEKTT